MSTREERLKHCKLYTPGATPPRINADASDKRFYYYHAEEVYVLRDIVISEQTKQELTALEGADAIPLELVAALRAEFRHLGGKVDVSPTQCDKTFATFLQQYLQLQ